MIERSAARISPCATRVSRRSSIRAYAFENASSGSPVSALIGLIDFHVTEPTPSIRHRIVPGKLSCPSVRERLKPLPAAPGPLQSFGFLVHR